jgi:hypothetical protein
MTRTAQRTFIASIQVRHATPLFFNLSVLVFYEPLHLKNLFFVLRDCSHILSIDHNSTETMQWTHPDTVGDLPPPCRAHTSTLYDRKLLIYGGGLGSTYYDAVYVLDTTTRRWSRPKIAPGPRPAARRAHSAVFYRGKVWIFGGGTGLTALNDVWTLDVSGGAGTKERPMLWEEIETGGKKPGPRGYHTANLIGNMMVVIGGSDGKESFTDVWCLNLGELGLSIYV